MAAVFVWAGVTASGAGGDDRRAVVFFGDEDYPPIAFLENGKPKGMDVDLVTALAGPLGREVRVELMDWNVAQERLLKGEGDALIGMSITEERKARFDFAHPVFLREFSLLVRSGDLTVGALEDLKGKKTGVTAGGFPRRFLEGHEGMDLILIKNYQDGFERLKRGEIEAIAADRWVAAYLLEKDRVRGINVVERPFATAPIAIAVKKGNSGLLKEINDGLAELKEEGRIAEIERRWKPQEMLFFSRARVRRLMWEAAAIAGLVLVAGLVLWIVTLRRDIAERKRAEEALHKSEEKFARFFASAPAATAVTVPSAGGRILDVNEEFTRMLGYTRGETIGRTTVELGLCDERTREQLLAHAGPGGGLKDFELGLRAKNGAIVLGRLSAQFIEIEGQTLALASFVDITESKRAEEQLRASREQLRALAGRLQAVREEERTRIAREIHDVLAQELTRMKIDLGWLSKRLGGGAKEVAPDTLLARVNTLNQLADTTIGTVQKIAAELRPVVLDSLGLCAAMEWQAEEFEARTGIHCEAILPEEDLELDRESATGLFRIVQESLTNVVRHAQATQVEIILELEGEQLRLEIQDDGVGFDSSRMKDPYSLGLLGMQERALLLEGRFEISGAAGKGTRVSVTMPMARHRGAAEKTVGETRKEQVPV